MERKFLFLFCSCLFICSILFSCKEYSRRQMEGLLSEYIDEKICYPRGVGYITADSDIVSGNERKTFYTILNYVDSIGCIGCKLKLNRWDIWVHELDSIFAESVKVIFLCHPMIRNELDMYIAHDNFSCPINFDIRNEFFNNNKVLSTSAFQTFLLDKNNRVLAVGNPIHNPKVKELYLKIIRGETANQEEETPRTQTTMEADRMEADMGRFDWREEQTAEFVLKNTGDNLLVIFDVCTSCGCTRVEYDGKPARPGESVVLRVTYRADNPGHFRKEVTVRSNAEQELLKLTVTGEAEERKG